MPSRLSPDAQPIPPDAVIVGRIAGAFGVQGWVRIEPFAPASESVLRKTRAWWLVPFRATSVPAGAAAPAGRPIQVETVRLQGDRLIARLPGIEVREAAEALKGTELAVSRSSFSPAADGEYYWVDLIGCSVVDREGRALGVVERVEEFGAHPVLMVCGIDAAEHLIPMVERHVLAVDLSARRIQVDWALDY